MADPADGLNSFLMYDTKMFPIFEINFLFNVWSKVTEFSLACGVALIFGVSLLSEK